MQPRSAHLIHGAVAGAIAGTVVILWFFTLGVIEGAPLATPTLLASVLLHRDAVTPTFGVVAGYTLLHYGIFVLLGVATSGVIRALGLKPALRHGVVFGLGVLNAVHYGAFLATDAQMLAVLPAVHVVLANLLGGMAMMAYLHRVEGVTEPLGLAGLKQYRLAVEGIGTGIIGASTVAIWFLLLDILWGRPFFTPGALGAALFLGVTSPSDVAVTLGLVATYTVLHFATFFVVGVALVWVSERIERTPGFWLLAVMGFIVVEAGFLGAAGMLGGWVLGALGGWLAVLAGNLLAVGAMGRWIWTRHPALRESLIAQPVATMM